MKRKKHVHKVTLNETRRQTKRRTDLFNKGASAENLQAVFDACYRGPLSALYRKIKGK
jgi:hypothetical protein